MQLGDDAQGGFVVDLAVQINGALGHQIAAQHAHDLLLAVYADAYFRDVVHKKSTSFFLQGSGPADFCPPGESVLCLSLSITHSDPVLSSEQQKKIPLPVGSGIFCKKRLRSVEQIIQFFAVGGNVDLRLYDKPDGPLL